MFRKGSKTEKYFQELCGSLDISLSTGKFVVDLDMDTVLNDLVAFRNLSRVTKMRLLYEDPACPSHRVLTDKGLALALVYCLKKKFRLLPGSDVCLVIFDIPQQKTYLRRPFYGFLHELGFIRVQKSVFTSRQDVASHLQYYLELMRFDDWVKVYIAREEPTPLKAS